MRRGRGARVGGARGGAGRGARVGGARGWAGRVGGRGARGGGTRGGADLDDLRDHGEEESAHGRLRARAWLRAQERAGARRAAGSRDGEEISGAGAGAGLGAHFEAGEGLGGGLERGEHVDEGERDAARARAACGLPALLRDRRGEPAAHGAPRVVDPRPEQRRRRGREPRQRDPRGGGDERRAELVVLEVQLEERCLLGTLLERPGALATRMERCHQRQHVHLLAPRAQVIVGRRGVSKKFTSNGSNAAAPSALVSHNTPGAAGAPSLV